MVKDKKLGKLADTSNDVNLGTCLPLWTTIEDVESMNWLNRFLLKLWPRIDEFLKETLHNQVTPEIQKANSMMASFKFSNVEMGQNPPEVVGIKTYAADKVAKDKIMMDLQVAFNSNINFGVSVGYVSAGICDLIFRGLLRLEFQPVLSRPPFFGGVAFGFIDDPVIDFDFTNLLNFLDFPGFEGLLRGIIRSVLGNLLVSPNKISVKLDAESDISTLKYPFPEGVLRAQVLEGRKLLVGDINLFGPNSSDAYIHMKVGSQALKTKVIEKTVNPKWKDECFEFMVMDMLATQIVVNCLDYDLVSAHDFLGKLCLPCKEIFDAGTNEEWRKLEGVNTGEVRIKFEWLTLTNNKDKLFEAIGSAGETKRGSSCLLHCFVMRCANLPEKGKSMDKRGLFGKMLGKSKKCKDSNVKISCKLENMKTPFVTVGKPWAKPEFDHGFQILVRDPRAAEILFRVESEDCQQLLGHVKYSLTRLINKKNLVDTVKLKLMESGKDSTLQVKLRLRFLLPKS